MLAGLRRPGLAVIFPVNGIAHVVAFVLDSPVLPDVSANIGGGHFTGFPSPVRTRAFSLLIPVAGDLEHLAADECGHPSVREIDSRSAGNPSKTIS